MKKNRSKRDLKRIPCIILGLVFLSLCVNPPQPKGEMDAIAVWQHFDEEQQEWNIWYSIWDGTEGFWWTPKDTAAPISEMEGDDWDPNIEFGPPTSAIAVWSNQKTGDIYYSRWYSSILAWIPEAVIDEVEGLDIDPDVAYNSNEKAIAVWVHIENEQRIIYYSCYDGATWSTAEPLIDDYELKNASLPEISFEVEDEETAIAVWCEGDEIFYSQFDGVNWSPPDSIPGQPGGALGDYGNYTELRLGISEYGSVKAVWQSGNEVYCAVWNGSSWEYPEAVGKEEMPETDNDFGDMAMVVYINSQDVWSSYEGTGFSSMFAANSGDKDFRPAVTFLHTDNALAVWWSTKTWPSEIYYSSWTGSSWSTPESIVPGGLGGEDKNPEISSRRE